MTNHEKKVHELLTNLNIPFQNLSIYVSALTHPSYVKSKDESYTRINNYQELEFFGDSILQFLSAKHVFFSQKKYDAGKLTLYRAKLVCTDSLNSASEKIGLKKYLLTGPGLMKTQVLNSKKVGADIFEAFLCALFLDLKSLDFIDKFVNKHLFEIEDENITLDNLKDYKTKFQEYIQSFSKNSVVYKSITINQKEKQFFKVKAYVDNIVYGEGLGITKQEAEEEAAKDALSKFQQ